MAATQVNLRRYSNAAQHLEQALDHQRNVESAIQTDLLLLQFRLGVTHALAGDLDRAVDCLEECLEVLEEDARLSDSDLLVPVLLKLSNLYHVKALLQLDDSLMINLLATAHAHSQKAFELDQSAPVRVQCANQLLQRGDSAEALQLLLPMAFFPQWKRCSRSDVTFTGVEHTLLPEAVQQEADESDVFIADTAVFAHLLAIQCCRDLHLHSDLTDCLVSMYCIISSSRRASDWSMMAHAFAEGKLYEDAASCFFRAASFSQEPALIRLAFVNCVLCLLLSYFETLKLFIAKLATIKVCVGVSCTVEQLPATRSVETPNNLNLLNRRTEWRGLRNRDSGYFEATTESGSSTMTSSTESEYSKPIEMDEMQVSNRWSHRWHSNETDTNVLNGNMTRESWTGDNHFTSDNHTFFNRQLSHGSERKRGSSDDTTDSDTSMREVSDDDDYEWQVFEETIETPPEILALITKRTTLA